MIKVVSWKPLKVEIVSEDAGNDDYLGYCKHGVCVFWQHSETKPSSADFKSVYEMRRGTIEQARKELAECPQCKSARNVKGVR